MHEHADDAYDRKSLAILNLVSHQALGMFSTVTVQCVLNELLDMIDCDLKVYTNKSICLLGGRGSVPNTKL